MGCPASESGGLTAIQNHGHQPTPTMSIAWCGGPDDPFTSPAVSQTDINGSDTIVWVEGAQNALYGLDGDTGAGIFAGSTPGSSGQPAIQAPIIANGRIFVTSDSQVYAFKP